MNLRGGVYQVSATPGTVKTQPTGQDRFREAPIWPVAILDSCQIANAHFEPPPAFETRIGLLPPDDNVQ
jgi:hypothetical protein